MDEKDGKNGSLEVAENKYNKYLLTIDIRWLIGIGIVLCFVFIASFIISINREDTKELNIEKIANIGIDEQFNKHYII